MKYWGPINSTGGINGNDPYVDGVVASGIEGSIPSFSGYEQTLRELSNLVTKAGLTPNATINGVQVAQAIQTSKLMQGVTGGTANAQTVTLDPAPAAYSAGMILNLLAFQSNTGDITINANGLGAKQIISNVTGSALQGGDIKANTYFKIIYDSVVGKFRLLSGSPAETIRNALFPYCRFINSGTYTPSTGVQPMTTWNAGTGDPNIISGFNTSTSLFTIPTGMAGLWLFQSYVNTLSTPTTGQQPASGFGYRLYKGNTSTGTVSSAANSPNSTIVHATVMAFENLNDGDTMQLAAFANETGIGLTNFYFTAIRLGRST